MGIDTIQPIIMAIDIMFVDRLKSLFSLVKIFRNVFIKVLYPFQYKLFKNTLSSNLTHPLETFGLGVCSVAQLGTVLNLLN